MVKGGKGDLARKYLRAAAQRLAAAQFLFEAGYSFDAAYLGGYAIECSLKSVILCRIPRALREGFAVNRLRGRTGHDFDWLRLMLGSLGTEVPGQVLRDMRIFDWSTSLRYEVGEIESGKVKNFLVATDRILNWAKRSV